MEKIIKMLKKYKEVISYLIFGVLTTVVSLAVYYLSVFTFLKASISKSNLFSGTILAKYNM